MMKFLRRKRLRKLYKALFGSPTLIIPSVTINPYRGLQKTNPVVDDDFLWVDEQPARPLRVTPSIGDEEWVRYKNRLHEPVTYDAEAAQTRLLKMLRNERNDSIPRFVVESPFETQTNSKENK